MANNPLKSTSVPQTVRDELSKRSEKNGILWAAKRFPWIQLTSLSSICNPQYKTLSSIANKSLYEKDFIRPLPTITEVNVKKQGELGTTRRTTITLNAYTDNQLVELQKCYFIPGMSCRVEWGWTESASKGKTSGPVPVGGENSYEAKALCLINTQAAKDPSYNGVQGLVTNFSYNLTTENYWTCTLEIVSAAEAFAGTKINDVGCECVVTRKNEESKDDKPKTREITNTPLYTKLANLVTDFEKTVTAIRKDKNDFPSDGVITQLHYNGIARDVMGKDDRNWWEKYTPQMLNNNDTTEAYISWSVLEWFINKQNALSTNGKEILGTINSTNIELPNIQGKDKNGHDYWTMSADPTVCIIPGANLQVDFTPYTPPTVTDALFGLAVSSAPLTNWYFGHSDKLVQLAVKEQSIPTAISSDNKTVALNRILINVLFLLEKLRACNDNNNTVSEFMLSVLDGINEACGSPWEFAITNATETETTSCEKSTTKLPTLTVIETKHVEGQLEPYYIPATPFGSAVNNVSSVIRDIKLETKLTEAMKTQALYSNAQQSNVTPAGAGCGANAFKPFTIYNNTKAINESIRYELSGAEADLAKAGKKPVNTTNQPTTPKPKYANSLQQNYTTPTDATKVVIQTKTGPVTRETATNQQRDLGGCNTLCDPYGEQTKPLKQLVDALKERVEPGNIDGVKNYLRKQFANAVNEDGKHCDGMMLPISFNFTLDGIGGFKFGQMISCDRIPENIRNSYYWQITAVEHTINANDWTTTVNTIPRYKSTKK